MTHTSPVQPNKLNTVRSLHSYYMRDNPSPSRVYVYHNSIKPVPDEPGFLQASVKVCVNYVGLREHKVNLRFKTDTHGNLIPATLAYLY